MNALNISRSVAGDEILQVIAVWAVLAEVGMIEQPLCAAVGADAVRVLFIVPDRPAHTRMPATAEQDRRDGAESRHRKPERPKPPGYPLPI